LSSGFTALVTVAQYLHHRFNNTNYVACEHGTESRHGGEQRRAHLPYEDALLACHSINRPQMAAHLKNIRQNGNASFSYHHVQATACSWFLA